MVAADGDGRGDFAFLHQVVDGFAHFCALAVAEPADARGKSLEGEAAAGESQPAGENLVVGEKFEGEFVGAVDVLGIAGERDPAERPLRRCRRAGGCTRGRSRG